MTKLTKFLLIAISSIGLCCCSDNNAKDSSTSSSPEYKIEDYIDIDLSTQKIQKLSQLTIHYELKQEAEISFVSSNENIEIKDVDSVLLINGNIIGNSELIVNLHVNGGDFCLGKKEIEVIEKVFYLPVPEHKLVFKGVGKVATVSVVLIDKNNVDTPCWSVEDDSIISLESQGFVAIISSLSRGITSVTFSLGEYSESFDVYVTNIRGDL